MTRSVYRSDDARARFLSGTRQHRVTHPGDRRRIDGPRRIADRPVCPPKRDRQAWMASADRLMGLRRSGSLCLHNVWSSPRAIQLTIALR